MQIAILHDLVTDADAADAMDVLAQAGMVEAALSSLGHTSLRIPCTLDLGSVRKKVTDAGAGMVFNLVESIEGKGRLIHLLPSLLDAMEIPYTGAPAEAVLFTSNKLLSKRVMAAASIPTPPWVSTSGKNGCRHSSLEEIPGDQWIIKSVWEHASIGLSGDCLVRDKTGGSLLPLLTSRAPAFGGSCFAERFIDGREFNLSLLDGPNGPLVLPPAEIVFEDFPEDMPRIVDYRAKWDEDAFSYHHTLRRFDFPSEDQSLLAALHDIALNCWDCFGLCGYARVDFRVDASGRPWVLEVNTNPCLSPDAGFAAALHRAGISQTEAIRRILESGLQMAEGKGQRAESRLQKAEDRGRRVGKSAASQDIVFRNQVIEPDRDSVRHLVELTGFFHDDEVDVAVELVEENLRKGDESGYFFIMADDEAGLAGYACFGPIPCTKSSFDLYWIAVRPEFQGKGLGRRLMTESEKRIKELGGTRIYVDTSSREQYAGTRAFYERCDYQLEIILEDFYAEGDGKALYCKIVRR